MTARAALLFSLFYLCLSLSPKAAVAQFFPPGVLNPGATTDSGDDWSPSHVIDPTGAIHVVWASDHDVTGNSGTDRDIFYARLDEGVWSAPELVSTEHSPVLDPTFDVDPRLVASAGSVEVVWQGRPVDNSGESDVFYSRRYSWGWRLPLRLHGSPGLYADSRPNLIRRSGGVLVAWERSVQGQSNLWWVHRPTGSHSFSSPRQLNHHFHGDGTSDHVAPVALASTSDGTIVAAWATDESLNGVQDPGNDFDVVYSELGPVPSENWSDWSVVHVEALSDSADDRDPAVVVVPGQGVDEYNFVWSSDSDRDGAGSDTDLFHAVIVPQDSTIDFAEPVNTTFATDADPDFEVSLCVEPGGVLHAVWTSSVDLLTGSDLDVYYAHNARRDESWTNVGLLGWNAPFDGAAAHDLQPQIACAGDGILSGVWASSDPLGGPYGNDFDILHAIGVGAGVSRPRSPGGRYYSLNDQGVQIVADASGRLHAAWSSEDPTLGGEQIGSDGDIFYAWRDDHGWSQPELVNTSAVWDSGYDRSPQLGVDATGRVHVVWTSTESFAGVFGLDDDLFYSVRDSQGFSPPLPVNDAANDGNGDNRVFSLAVEGDGTVHVVFVEPNVGSLQYTTGNASGVFATSSTVAGTYVGSPRMVLDNAGDPHVVYSWAPGATLNQDFEIAYQTLQNGGWSTPRLINDASGDGTAFDIYADLAIDSNGKVHVVWSSDYNVGGSGPDRDLFYSRMDGSGWTTPAPLFDHFRSDSGIDESPRVMLDEDDTLHVLWQSTDPLGGGAGTDRDLFYATVAPGALLPSPSAIRVANATGWADEWDDLYPSLAVDLRGQAHFAWSLFRNLGNHYDSFDALYANVPRPRLIIASDFESSDLVDWTVAP